MIAVGLTTHILNNHLKSAFLLAGLPFLFILMIAGFFLGMDLMLQTSVAPGAPFNWQHAFDESLAGTLHYGGWAVLAAGIWFVIAFFFHGSMMRAATKSRPVTRTEMPRIYNMLENLCISRGLPMPQFEIIDAPALNAFASGINDKSYRIVLTQGLVDRLADDELEAVIGHELTHIVNRDVRLLIIAVIFVGMISFLAEAAFRTLLRSGRVSRRGGKKGNLLPVLLLALLILAIGYMFAIVIRFALSRKREYLADAGAVELTKNPEAMMRALMKISGHDRVKDLPDEVEQMCIENSHNFMGMFATHPKIEDRIKTISEMTRTPVPVLPQIS